MNAMIASFLINVDMSNYKPNISDASHRIKPSPDGASLVQATLAEAYQQTPWMRRISGYMSILIVSVFIGFVFIPELVFERLRPDVLFSTIYPYYFEYLLENNIIKKTLFPMSAYALWSVIPFFTITAFVLFILLLFPSNEFKYFLIRRNNKEKKLLGYCIFVIVVYIVVLHADRIPSVADAIMRPFEYKHSFFIIYCGGAFSFSGAIALLAMDFRARLFNRG